MSDKKATLTVTMDMGDAAAADPARAAGALENLIDRLLSGRFDGNQEHELRDATGAKIGTWSWGETEKPTARELGEAMLFIDRKNKRNPNSCTSVSAELTTPMWHARGIFASRAGISLSSAVTAAASALGWKR
jgi:hypothetical protein